MKKIKPFVLLICLIMFVSLVGGVTTTEFTYSDNFEDNNLVEYSESSQNIQGFDGDTYDIKTQGITVFAGNYSYKNQLKPGGGNDREIVISTSRESFKLPNNSVVNISLAWNHTHQESILCNSEESIFRLIDESGDILQIKNDRNEIGATYCGSSGTIRMENYGWVLSGDIINNTNENLNNTPTKNDETGKGVWRNVTLQIDYSNDEVRLYSDNLLIHNTELTGELNGNITIQLESGARVLDTWFYVDNIEIGPDLESINLELDTPKYLDHSSKNKYKVYNNGKDITNEANVSSGDTSIITVNETTNELVSTDNLSKNKKVTITAEFNSVTITKNVTVATANMSNIDILPNTKWVKAFSGFEEASSNYGLGSEIQWIFFIIIMMVTFTHLANKWVGIGIGEILLILFWITQYISLGVFLGSMVFGILLLLTQVNQSQTVTYESRSPPENF